MPDPEKVPLPGWVVPGNVRHERVLWTAAKPRLEKLNRKWWHSLFALGRTADIDERGLHGSSTDREELSKGMQASAFVVDGLADRFSPAERDALRQTGRLPSWFWPAYERDVASERRK